MLNVAKKKKRLRLGITLLGGVLGVYFVGYAVCRQSHFVVHISACAADKYSLHDIVEGDAKFASPNPALAAFYTPLRYLETFYWYLAKPIGSACT